LNYIRRSHSGPGRAPVPSLPTYRTGTEGLLGAPPRSSPCSCRARDGRPAIPCPVTGVLAERAESTRAYGAYEGSPGTGRVAQREMFLVLGVSYEDTSDGGSYFGAVAIGDATP